MTITLLITALASLVACVFFILHTKKKMKKSGTNGEQSELVPVKKKGKWKFVRRYLGATISGTLAFAVIVTMIVLYCTMHGTYGRYGDNVKWSYYDGVLTIYGQGPMADADNGNDPGWKRWGLRIEEVVVEDGVTSVTNVYYGNTRKISYAESVKEIELLTDGGLEEIKLSSNCANFWLSCTSLKTVQFGEDTKTIAGLHNCRALRNLEFPNGVEEVSGFDHSDKLEDLEFPDTVKIISGFDYCENLRNLELSEGLKSISGFNNCKRLEEMEFPRDVEQVSGFNECIGLDSIVFPEELKYITEGSFASCYELKSITFRGDLPAILHTEKEQDEEWDRELFRDSVATIYYPKGNPTWENLDRDDFGRDITFVGI